MGSYQKHTTPSFRHALGLTAAPRITDSAHQLSRVNVQSSSIAKTAVSPHVIVM